MLMFTWDDSVGGLCYDGVCFPVSKKVEGKWSMENKIIIDTLVGMIYDSGMFLSHMMSKHECINNKMSMLMYLTPAIVDFYHTEEYPREAVKKDIYNAIRDIGLCQMIGSAFTFYGGDRGIKKWYISLKPIDN